MWQSWAPDDHRAAACPLNNESICPYVVSQRGGHFLRASPSSTVKYIWSSSILIWPLSIRRNWGLPEPSADGHKCGRGSGFLLRRAGVLPVQAHRAAHSCVCIYVYVCVCIYVYVRICTCVYVYVFVYMCVCMYICMCVC